MDVLFWLFLGGGGGVVARNLKKRICKAVLVHEQSRCVPERMYSVVVKKKMIVFYSLPSGNECQHDRERRPSLFGEKKEGKCTYTIMEEFVSNIFKWKQGIFLL